jgi:hypothetical protein
MKKKLEQIKEKQDENWEWFKSFDRRVYLLHVQMAAQLDKELKEELVERYRFQLEVQRLYQESRAAFNKADAYLSAYAAASRGEWQAPPDFPGEVIQVLREQWKALKNIIKDAREINLPAMKNFEEGENLADFILEGKMVPEPPLSYVKGVWIDKLMNQLQGVRQKCFRLHFKSVGGVLALQEKIAAQWKAMREPVAAEVVEAVEAEVIPAEVIPAEVVPADPVPAAPAASAPAAPPVTVPAAPVPEAPKAMAAFVAPAPPDLPPAPPVAAQPTAVMPPLAPAPTPAPEVAPPAPARPQEPAPVAAADGTFSLDADDHGPAPARPAGQVFSFDADEPATPQAAEPAFSLDADDHKPARPAEPRSATVPGPAPRQPAEAPLSGVAPSPAPRAVFGTGPRVLPSSGKRPPLKITVVKPGETSPLQKA